MSEVEVFNSKTVNCASNHVVKQIERGLLGRNTEMFFSISSELDSGENRLFAQFGFRLVDVTINNYLFEDPALGLSLENMVGVTNKFSHKNESSFLLASKSLLSNLYHFFAEKFLSRPIVQRFLSLLILASIITSGIWVGPKIYYKIFNDQEIPVEAQGENIYSLSNYALESDGVGQVKKVSDAEKEIYAPTVDESLPGGDWIIIPKIGVKSQLQAGENFEEALLTGVWLVPDFGEPGDKSAPMIIAAHRFGWKWWWEDDYWRYNSFYLLPDLEEGDLVQITSNEKKWVYEIYSGDEGQEITDYNADLILYTCKYLDSPVRIFKYAKIVDLNNNS